VRPGVGGPWAGISSMVLPQIRYQDAPERGERSLVDIAPLRNAHCTVG
jgi:hypothetical protein